MWCPVLGVECSGTVLRNWIHGARVISSPSLMHVKPALGIGQSAPPARLWQGDMDLSAVFIVACSDKLFKFIRHELNGPLSDIICWGIPHLANLILHSSNVLSVDMSSMITTSGHLENVSTATKNCFPSKGSCKVYVYPPPWPFWKLPWGYTVNLIQYLSL